MAPRTRAKKPAAEQTFKSKPALKQKRLPARRRTVTHKSKRPPLEKRQSTLTQIVDFGRLSSREELDDISDDDEFDEKRPPNKRRRTSAKTKSESRKDRTLTQMDFVKTPKRTMPVDDSEEEGTLSDEEDLGNEELHLTPRPGTKGLNLRRSPRRILEIADSTESLETIGSISAGHRTVNEEESREQVTTTITNNDAGIENRGHAMLPPVVPQTPKRVRMLVVPSSQTPPTTPLSTQQSPRCPGSGKDRSPLQERSTNIPIMKDMVEGVSESIVEAAKPASPFVTEFEPAPRETQPIDSPTKRRARDFRAQMDALRNGGALQQTRRKARTFERGKIIRSSTNVSLMSEIGENEVSKIRPKNGDTQFAIGEETQSLLGDIDLSGEVAQEPEEEPMEAEAEAEDEEIEAEAEVGDQNENISDLVEGDEDENTIFEIGEPQEPLENEFDELPDRTNEPEDDTPLTQDLNRRESSPELPFDNYEEDDRVPSSKNETPRGTRGTDYDTTPQNRHVTFFDQLDTLTLPIPGSPRSTAPLYEEIDTQESRDPASAQLIYESQAAYAELAASSPIEAEPMPIPTSSPVATRNSSQLRFHTPRVPRKNTQVQFAEEDEAQAPSTGRTESLSTTSGTYPKSALKGERQCQTRSSQGDPSPLGVPSSQTRSSPVQQIPSSPLQRDQQPRSEPATPGIFRFLRGPVTASQLIPDSLRSDIDDEIGLPPRWTQDEDEEEDDDDDEL